MRTRSYGITANCHQQEKLARCRDLLGHAQPAPNAAPNAADGAPCTDRPVPSDSDAARCPTCGAPMRVIEILTPTAAAYDTS